MIMIKMCLQTEIFAIFFMLKGFHLAVKPLVSTKLFPSCRGPFHTQHIGRSCVIMGSLVDPQSSWSMKDHPTLIIVSFS